MLRNPISNAVKHNDVGAGRISVSAAFTDECYEVRIEDDDLAIPIILEQKPVNVSNPEIKRRKRR